MPGLPLRPCTVYPFWCMPFCRFRLPFAGMKRATRLVVCAALVWLGCRGPAWAQKTPPPNIIYIMADDLGYADLGCYGNKTMATPHLDALAASGVLFTQAYSAAPMCTPTRTAFMTGRYPAKTPVGLREPLDWTKADSTVGLSPDIPSLPALLKKQGYSTYLVGKWHLGFSPAFSPNKNGFDYFFGYHGGGVDYVTHTDPRGMPDLYENEMPINQDGYMTDLLQAKALEIITAKHDNPFFLSLQFSAPHWPWQAPGDTAYPLGNKQWKEGGSPATYRAMVQSMDTAMGIILHTLKQTGLDQNTLVIFTSDNGGEKWSDNSPFSGRKMKLNEGGIRVPAIVSWPQKIAAGTVNHTPIITMDWTATLLALAGGSFPASHPTDGLNLWPMLAEQTAPPERILYWRITQRSQQQALRQGQWKYLKTEEGEFLYDMATDAAEKMDVKAAHPTLLAHLKQIYAAWAQTVMPPVPLVKND